METSHQNLVVDLQLLLTCRVIGIPFRVCQGKCIIMLSAGMVIIWPFGSGINFPGSSQDLLSIFSCEKYLQKLLTVISSGLVSNHYGI